MENEKLKALITELNALLACDIPLNCASYRFESLSIRIREMHVPIEVIEISPFYPNSDLQKLNIKRQKLLDRNDPVGASRVHSTIRKMQTELKGQEGLELEHPQSNFSLMDGCIIAKLNNSVPNSKLLLELITELEI